MKLVSKSFEPGSGEPGAVKLIPEEAEDMWHLYNLIAAGDRVQATTVRKVSFESGGAGGGSESERVKLKLTLAVEAADYDGAAGELRIRGRNMTESDHIKLGGAFAFLYSPEPRAIRPETALRRAAYHSLDLAVGRAVSIEKDSWDAAHGERIASACNPAASATLAAVVMQEGLAHLCLVGGATTTVRARIEASMPRKAGPAAAGYDKALKKFFDALMTAVLRHVDFAVVRCLLIAGPGFTKDAFVAHLFAEAQRRELKPLLEARSKVITAHASSGYKHALAEALASPALAARVADTAAAAEVAALDAFYAMMSGDPSRAFYGPGHVRAAAELGAVQTLLLSDELYRTADAGERAAWVALVAAVRAAGGDAHVFSAGHLSGQRLTQVRRSTRLRFGHAFKL